MKLTREQIVLNFELIEKSSREKIQAGRIDGSNHWPTVFVESLLDDWLEMEAALRETVGNATLSNVKEIARNHGWDESRFLSSWLDENLAPKVGMREEPKATELSRIVEYTVAMNAGSINMFLQKGWELYGSPMRRVGDDPPYFIQAMVRRESAK